MHDSCSGEPLSARLSAESRNTTRCPRWARITLALAFVVPLTAQSAAIGPLSPLERAFKAYQLRSNAAQDNLRQPLVAHPANGDEIRYSNRMNSYTKGLPHDDLGIVDAAAYQALINALKSGENADFEAIPKGVNNGAAQRNPQAAYTFYLEGRDPHAYTMPAAPAFRSAWQASDAIEVMWQALTRDVSFIEYETNALISEAVTDLSAFSDFRGPKDVGQVTANTLFRGIGVGETTGPYISQFLLQPIPAGASKIDQKYKVPVVGNDHMTQYSAWLNIQRGGGASTSATYETSSRYLYNGRALAEYVLKDYIDQAYSNAALILNGYGGAALSDTNPFKATAAQANGPLFSLNHALDMLARVSMSSQSVAWFQKWLVHRRARPEVFFGRVHNHKTGQASYPLHAELLASAALPKVYAKYGTYLLPTAVPAGSPLHPSYPAGHSTMAGAAVTMLKAFYKGDHLIPAPKQPSADGLSLVDYSGPALTVEGELNKLASNIALGRDTAGVHYRSDSDLGIVLGEELAISVLQELVNGYNEDVSFSFNRFDGAPVTISKQ